MSKTSTTGCERRAMTKIRRVSHGRAVKPLAGAAAIYATVWVGLLAVSGSGAATTKQATPQAKAAVVECRTIGHLGIPGVVINHTNVPLKRTFVEHGPVSGFFKPEPPAEIPSQYISGWCVGSHFGVEAMKVDYVLPNREKVHFEASYGAFGFLWTSCAISGVSESRPAYGCFAERLGPGRPSFCKRDVGCSGSLRNKGAMAGAEVGFEVFPD